mmetsp:Transcript_78653/g.228268  ORF Transcript_78653/g.228268 Transcript_78653/m.228268 type:complete len:241 (-) Transcript_78653:48-770(-)
MRVDLLLAEPDEAGPLLRNDADLDVGGLEVHAHDSLQCANRLLDGLSLGQVELLFDDLLQGVDGFGVFRAGCTRLVAHVHPGRVNLVQRRSGLVIDAVQHRVHAVGTHVGVLRVHLADVRDLQREEMDRNLVAVLVLELRRDFAGAVYQRASVGSHSRHEAPDVGRDVVQVCDEVLVHELVGDLLLRHAHNAVVPPQGHRSHILILLHRLVCVLDLMQPALRREDCDVAVVAGSPRHGST